MMAILSVCSARERKSLLLFNDEDDDEFGEPRAFATKVAVRKIAEDILNDIMTTW